MHHSRATQLLQLIHSSDDVKSSIVMLQMENYHLESV